MIGWYFDLSDVSSLQMNMRYMLIVASKFINFQLMLVYFMIKKHHDKQELLLWPQVPFKFV